MNWWPSEPKSEKGRTGDHKSTNFFILGHGPERTQQIIQIVLLHPGLDGLFQRVEIESIINADNGLTQWDLGSAISGIEFCLTDSIQT